MGLDGVCILSRKGYVISARKTAFRTDIRYDTGIEYSCKRYIIGVCRTIWYIFVGYVNIIMIEVLYERDQTWNMIILPPFEREDANNQGRSEGGGK